MIRIDHLLSLVFCINPFSATERRRAAIVCSEKCQRRGSGAFDSLFLARKLWNLNYIFQLLLKFFHLVNNHQDIPNTTCVSDLTS